VGKDAFLACTQGVIKEYKNQGISKAMFSGEGLYVYKMSGLGILWMSTFGAVLRKDVSDTSNALSPPFPAAHSFIRSRGPGSIPHLTDLNRT
jgi:hypothetical protein